MSAPAPDLDRVKEVLDESLRRPAPEREAFVDAACGGDEALRREVLSLLGHEAQSTAFLDRPFFSLRAAEPLRGGERIGPYRVVREIGRGGMGTVALAVREDDFEKRVALKVIRPELLSEGAVRRFHNERQLLADLEHPGIARILDAGTAVDGRPYFVMEHVEGLPIGEYCADHKLSVGARLRLAVEVCEALHAAHQRLVVHRDLKPSNVLVTEEGRPKLLDFGIAKRLGPEAGTALTRHGENPMTLRYASPEQIAEKSLTTASDVYSVGVVLYELLSGRPPYAMDDTSGLELALAIRDREPPRPSSAVRREAGRRNGEARRLARSLAGDLDAILLKALAKEPERRYASAAQLAEDLRRHLAGEPVLARKGTWIYRTGRFVRRHRLALAAGLTVVGLGLGLLATRVELLRRERHNEELSEGVLLFLKQTLHQAKPDVARGRDVPARVILDAGLRSAELFADDPLFQAGHLEKIGEVYVDLGLYADAREPLRKALELLREHHGGDHPDVARAINDLAGLEYRVNDYAEAERLYREALAMKRQIASDGVDLAKGMSNLATALTSQGEYDEAEAMYREALDLRIAAYGAEESGDVASSLHSLATLLYTRGHAAAAEPLLLQALEIRRQRGESRHTTAANVHSVLGRVYHALRRLDEARGRAEEALAVRLELLDDSHVAVAGARRDLAAVLVDLGELPAAASLLAQARPVLVRDLGEGSWQVAVADAALGALRAAEGRYDEAERYLAASYSTLLEKRGAEVVYTRDVRRRLDLVRERPGQKGEDLRLAPEALTPALSQREKE